MENIKLFNGDCLEVLPTLEANSVDAVVCDPPYELEFMSKSWDSKGISFDPKTWKEMLRVAKPGAYLLMFGGTRTFHRIACAIEDAGWIIKDCMMWLHSSGFPKSHDTSKRIDKMAGKERKILGYDENSVKRRQKKNSDQYTAIKPSNVGIITKAFIEKIGQITEPATELSKKWSGYGSQLKPAWEPIIMARKPLDRISASELYKLTGWRKLFGCFGKWEWIGVREKFPKTGIYKACQRFNLQHWEKEIEGGFIKCWLYKYNWHPLIPTEIGRKVLVGKGKKVILKEWEYVDRYFKNIALNSIKWGCGSINIDACRIGTVGGGTKCNNRDENGKCLGHNNSVFQPTIHTVNNKLNGLWPANFIMTHSPDCVKCGVPEENYYQNRWTGSASYFDGAGHQKGKPYTMDKKYYIRDVYNCVDNCAINILDKENRVKPSRFFYCSKVTKRERNAGLNLLPDRIQMRANPSGYGENDPKWSPKISKNSHPTLKGIELMQYLCRLVTPADGIILDPFMGSGTTGIATALEGCKFIGIEKEKDYYEIAEARIKWWSEQDKEKSVSEILGEENTIKIAKEENKNFYKPLYE